MYANHLKADSKVNIQSKHGLLDSKIAFKIYEIKSRMHSTWLFNFDEPGVTSTNSNSNSSICKLCKNSTRKGFAIRNVQGSNTKSNIFLPGDKIPMSKIWVQRFIEHLAYIGYFMRCSLSAFFNVRKQFIAGFSN